MCRQGIPDLSDYRDARLVSSERVTHNAADYPVDLWQKVASRLMDINPSDTLPRVALASDDDERHICPLQLEVIRRGIMLWTNPGDTS